MAELAARTSSYYARLFAMLMPTHYRITVTLVGNLANSCVGWFLIHYDSWQAVFSRWPFLLPALFRLWHIFVVRDWLRTLLINPGLEDRVSSAGFCLSAGLFWCLRWLEFLLQELSPFLVESIPLAWTGVGRVCSDYRRLFCRCPFLDLLSRSNQH